MMDRSFWVCLLTVILHSCIVSAQSDSQDAVAFISLVSNWQNKPSNWQGMNPCEGWVGIHCNNSRIITIQLSSMGLKGSLTGDIENLAKLQTLDLSNNPNLTGTLPPAIGKLSELSNLILLGCAFSGQIPDLGSLKQLMFLSLNSNLFSGEIPPSIGSLSKLYWLDLADNKLTGTIPISSGNTPGLDQLKHTRHFHFGNNQLSGTISDQLFSSDMNLLHVLFDNNQLSGVIPSTLGLVQTLEVVRLDRNSLSGPVPSNINNLTEVQELYLSNNKLTGPLPDLMGMNALSYVDLSNNTFDAADAPQWFSTLQSLTTLVAESCSVSGKVPPALFTIPQLQSVRLRLNPLNGTLNISSYSTQLQLVDLQNTRIDSYIEGVGSYDKDLILAGTPFCSQSPNNKYCSIPTQSAPYSSPPPQNCSTLCSSSDQSFSPNCICTVPYTGTLFFRAPSFSDLGNSSNFQALEAKLVKTFQSNQLPVDSVSLRNILSDTNHYLEVGLQVFPSNETSFSQLEIPKIGFILSNQTFKPPANFGPFYFIATPYRAFLEATPAASKSKNVPLIIGASVGGFVVALIIIGLAVYATHQSRKAKKAVEKSQPFASWDTNNSSGSIPQLKGARWFSFEELKKITNNFSEANDIGSGGYGKVYKGMLANGQLVAIKRAEQESTQGGLEFKTEIELLSRVHHKNLVSLVGFCFDQGEKMLVYEYIPNGSLKDSLTGKSGVRLDWKRRLRVALGAARGLSYLHELANPPIVHRDIKSSNILLDDRLNAKVSDFGLSKSLGNDQKGHVTTQVKGTMGYLDPEYYMTQQLTEKSDVYSFGVVLLELLTGRKPLERGRYVVREVKFAMNKSQDLYGLHEFLDPTISTAPSMEGFSKFVVLAINCVEESGVDRPTMSEVVKEIEEIMQLAGMNPHADSAQVSSSYEASGGHPSHPYDNEALPMFGGGTPSPR